MQSMSAHDAKARFGQLLDTARREPVTIEKHGRPVAVMLSKEEFDELEAMKLEATVAEGETYLADKNYAQAVSFYRALAQQPPRGRDTAAYAAAKAGEGQALYLDAAASNKPAQLRQAQLALAEAVVLDTAGGETTAKATYFHALCLLALGSERETEDFRSRAMAMLDTVVNQYPSSRWASEARTARNQ